MKNAVYGQVGSLGCRVRKWRFQKTCRKWKEEYRSQSRLFPIWVWRITMKVVIYSRWVERESL
jgi:hypothetical protein